MSYVMVMSVDEISEERYMSRLDAYESILEVADDTGVAIPDDVKAIIDNEISIYTGLIRDLEDAQEDA